MKLTRNPGKRPQASRDWFWFYFLFNNKEVTRAYFKSVAERPGNARNPENENGISFDMHSSEHRHTRKGE